MVVRKDKSLIYFFQQGKKSDTLESSNLFYLLVPDSFKKNLLIQVENAQIQQTKNDSLVTFVFIPGMNYEAWYTKDEDQKISKQKNMFLKSFVNGTNASEKNKITIWFILRKEGVVVLENTYYFKN